MFSLPMLLTMHFILLFDTSSTKRKRKQNKQIYNRMKRAKKKLREIEIGRNTERSVIMSILWNGVRNENIALYRHCDNQLESVVYVILPFVSVKDVTLFTAFSFQLPINLLSLLSFKNEYIHNSPYIWITKCFLWII